MTPKRHMLAASAGLAAMGFTSLAWEFTATGAPFKVGLWLITVGSLTVAANFFARALARR
jgi:hypothetical protein